MKIVYFRDRRGNFGDDLNPLIWNSLFPGHGRAPDLVLVGIGSILNSATFAGIPASARLVILGSGASYGPPPQLETHWRVAALRGPLSARLLGREKAAVTDGAILLAACPGLVPQPRHDLRGQVVFMPHAMSASPQWRRAAEAAGMAFADPSAPVSETLSLIAGARLVVAEAMHGAIVADTLRVPWVPVRISPRFDAFKWRDWSLSMGLDPEITELPAAGLLETVRHVRQRKAFADAGTDDALPFDSAAPRAAMIDYLERRHRGQPYARPPEAPRPMAIRAGARMVASLTDPALIARAAAALERAAEGAPYLSDDRLFARRLARMMDAAEEVRTLIGAEA